MQLLEGKVAIVTGGTRGIGSAIVRTFLNNGAKVALLGSQTETVARAIHALKEENADHEVIGFAPSLIDEAEVSATFKAVYAQFGKIDVLVNNAGMSHHTPLQEITSAEYDQVVNLNLKAVFVCTKTATAYLEETKGVILNASSMVTVCGQNCGIMYPATKFAVNGMTWSLARELAPKGIRVNAVAPGITETEMFTTLPEEWKEPVIKSVPLGRIGQPQDVANAYLFLASDMASYITGEILHVDGAART